jgi:hypothetical protein
MKVFQLISFLRTQPQHLTVAYKLFSEQCLLEEKDIKIEELGMARPDGWIPNARPDKVSQTYLVFPGL